MISVSIWRKTLVRLQACNDGPSSGMALFDRIASMQPTSDVRRLKRIRVARWTPLHQLWLATAYPSFCSWLRQNGLIPWIDLSGANLSGANLSGADLSGAYRPDGDLPKGWERGPDGYLRRKP